MLQNIVFTSEGHEIEGLLKKNSTTRGAIITHPHPLYGGDMNNSVVYAIMRAYQEKAYTTLRFNFRGVGHSQGSYAEGIGEQEDVRAAVAFMADMGIRHIDLAGYSFGSWVNALLAPGKDIIAGMVMVSPPVAFVDFTSIGAIDTLKLIVTGSRDDIAPAEQIRPIYQQWNPDARFEIIEGADHFYGGYTDKLKSILVSSIVNPDEPSL